MGTVPASAQQPEPVFDPAQKQAIEQIIREYLLTNPELLREVIAALGEREKLAAEGRRQTLMQELRPQLERHPDDPVMGNPEGAITIVEFFDYQCGYCKTVKPTLAKILAGNPDVRVVMKEFPILGEASVIAARAALAARQQGKYAALHDALMAFRGRLGEEIILEIAAKAGLDIEKLKADMQAPAIEEAIRRNYQLAEQLEISGTPAFIIGDALAPGAINEEQFAKLIAEARAKL
ncbi:MAG: DsbA family protein [Alphaproteobacteria bacterium]|nr:DsbA family protein [Alphaproteobacteria bacterium]MBU0796533.1 DsbA family protein [Alphaproteobacteria bacterium]MBU0885689.1 DsbA family protein [Alphaproteobacteria bacterium]MBU1811498.1 DsbA family protein [Alphaproteobacteria bacterium]